uniref:Tetratricopeptide repeat-containing protein n=1 Tax=Neospora caninum (strain Liverpool) TaxID=572307 RepID=A0A0F7U8Q7_NEOCL|nr:TPA: hypothetical protein BN1204_012680 [Neospora caninum Liverpool]
MTAPPVSVASAASASPPASASSSPLVPAAAAAHLQAAVRLIQEAQSLHQLPTLSLQDNAGKEKEKLHPCRQAEMLPVRISYLCSAAMKHLEACGLPFYGAEDERRGGGSGSVSLKKGREEHDSKKERLLSPRDASRGCLLGFQALVLLAESMRSLGKDREAVGCYTESFNWISEAMPVQQRAHALYRAASVMMDVRGGLERQRRKREEQSQGNLTSVSLSSTNASVASPVQSTALAPAQGEKCKGRKRKSTAPASASPTPVGLSSVEGRSSSASAGVSTVNEESKRQEGKKDVNEAQLRKDRKRREPVVCSRLRLASVLSPPQRPRLSLTDGESLRYCRRALEYVLLLQPNHAGASARLVKVLLLLGDFGAAAHALKYSLSLGLGATGGRSASKVRWLLRALRSTTIEEGAEHGTERERDRTERKKDGKGRSEADGNKDDVNRGGRVVLGASDVMGGEKSEEEDMENTFHMQFLEQDKQRIRRQLEELQREDATFLSHVRASSPSAPICLSLPPPPSHASRDDDCRGVFSLLAFLYSLLLAVDEALEIDEENAAPLSTPPATLALCRMVSVSRSSSPLPVPKHLERQLSEATRQVSEIFSPFLSCPSRRAPSYGSPGGGSSSPCPGSLPPAGLPAGACALSSQGRESERATPVDASQRQDQEAEKRGIAVPESASSSLSACGRSSRKKDTHVGRAQHQQRQLLLLQQQQQRSRNRLRQEKPRRLKFLHECDTPVSQLPFAFWKAFGRLMRIPHTHVPSCTPFASYEHMDALEQVWGDAWALSQLKSSGLSYKILHANATAAAFALAGKSGAGEKSEGRSRNGVKRDGKGSSGKARERGKSEGTRSVGSAGVAAPGGETESRKGGDGEAAEDQGGRTERSEGKEREREEENSGTKVSEKTGGAGRSNNDPSGAECGGKGASGAPHAQDGAKAAGKTSSATAAARGALQGVIAAATGVAGAAAGAPSLQWVLWQLQSAMEGTQSSSCASSGDTTPATREETDTASLCAEEPRQEDREGQKKAGEEGAERDREERKERENSFLLRSQRAQGQVLNAIEKALGGVTESPKEGEAQQVPLLVVLLRVIEALVSTRPLWQLTPYGLSGSAAASSFFASPRPSSFSSSLTPVAVSCLLSSFVSEGTRRLALASSFFCSRFSSFGGDTKDGGALAQKGEGHTAGVVVKVEETANGDRAKGSSCGNSGSGSGLWWRLEWSTLQRLRALSPSEGVSSAVGDTARVLLADWLGAAEPVEDNMETETLGKKQSGKDGRKRVGSSHLCLQVAACLLSAAAGTAPYVCSDHVSGNDAEGNEKNGDADQVSSLSKSSPVASPCHPFGAKIFHLSQLKDFLDVAGECLYTAAACWEMERAKGKDENEDREKEREDRKGEAGKEREKREGALDEENIRFSHLLKKLLAWLGLLHRQVAAAVGAGGHTEASEGFLSLPGDSGEGATGALAAVALLADLRDEEERMWGENAERKDQEREDGKQTGEQTGGEEEEENRGVASVVDFERTAKTGVPPKGKQTTVPISPSLTADKVDLWDVPPLHVLRRKAVAAAVAEGMDIELLESLVGPFASRSFARLVSNHGRQEKSGEQSEGEGAEEEKKVDEVIGAVGSPSAKSSVPSLHTSTGTEEDRQTGREDKTEESDARGTLSSSTCFSKLQFSRACIVEALVDTLREGESQLISLSLRLHDEARRHAAEETSAAIAVASTTTSQGGDKEEESCLSSGSGKVILSSDLQADILFFLQSVVPFLSHITRQLSALSASSLSLSSLSAPPQSKTAGKKGDKEAMVPLLVFVTPVLESFFLRITSLYGDLFTLLALTASRSLDSPLISCLGAALDPGFSMEETRRQRYGVHDKFVAALCSSLPVFLSSLGAFRRHSLGVAQREVSPGGRFESIADWLGSNCFAQAVGQERGGDEDAQAGRERTARGADEGSSKNDARETPAEEDSSPRDSVPASLGTSPFAALFPFSRSLGQAAGTHSQSGEKSCQFPTPTSQEALPSLDTPFCMWGVAVPAKLSTAQWLLRGRELAQAEEAEDDDDAIQRLLTSFSRPSAKPGDDTSSPSKTSKLASSTKTSSLPPSASSVSSSASPSTALPADGCYLHSSAARLCVALAAFTLIELVAVSAFCSACTSFLEKKKLPSLPTVAGPVAVAAGGGAGGAGAVFAAGVALVTVARKRGQAWKDFCFSGQLVRWTMHALLYLVAAPLEASAASACGARHAPNVGQGERQEGRQGKRKRGEEGGEAADVDGKEERQEEKEEGEETLLWQLHPLTSILSVKEDDDGCMPLFVDGASPDLGRGRTPASDASSPALMETAAETSSTPLSSPSSLSALYPVSSAPPHSPSSLSSAKQGSPPASSSSPSPSSSFALSLLGALGEVLGRNEERGVLEGGEYASRLAEVIRLSLEAEMVVRELAGGAGSSQLDGLPGFSAASPLSGAGVSGAGGGASGGANKINAGALLLMGEGKVKKGERGERAARAASAAPAAIAMLPEWLTPAYRQEEELPWEKKIEEIWIKGNAQTMAYTAPPPTSILGDVDSERSRRRQLPGLELYLPPGMCTSSLPLAALQVALRSIRPSPIRGFEREMLVLAASSSVSSLPSRPDADAARAAVREALTVRQESEGEVGAEEKRREDGERGAAMRNPRIEMAGTRLAPFATMSGSSAFLVVPLAARLLQLHLCATSQCQSDSSLSPACSAENGPGEGVQIRGEDKATDFAEEEDGEVNQPKPGNDAASICCTSTLSSVCWVASEVPDRLGDLAHSIACCYFLVYGQPVLPRPTSPLDKLVLKTTKEQTRSNFIEISLPAAILGVYIHRAVQKCGPWATELQSKETELSVSTFLFPSRETREFGRSVVAVADALVFNSSSPPDVSLPPCLPSILHLPDSLHRPPPSPYPPGLSFSLFWAYTGDPLVLPHFLRLFLLLVVQHFQLQQSVQVPIPMQHLLQQQTDMLSSSPFASLSATLARLFPLPSVRSLCNLQSMDDTVARSEDPSPSENEDQEREGEEIEMGEERLGGSRSVVTSGNCGAASRLSENDNVALDEQAASTWQKMSAIREKISQSRRTLGAASATVAAAESVLLGCIQGEDCKTLIARETEGREQGVLCGGKRAGHEIEEEDEELEVLRKASFEGTRIYIKLDKKGNQLSIAPLTSFSAYEQMIYQLELYQLLLLLHMLPISKQQYLINTYLADAGERESTRAALISCITPAPSSLSSFVATRLFPSSPSSALSGESPPRLSLPSLQSLSRRLARSAIEALERKPVHAISPSLRGFSLHLLQLLQQAQRTAASEPEALERAGFAIRAAACAPHNPTLWMAVGSLLLELLLLLLDKYCAAGRGDSGGGLHGREDEETARWARKIFSAFQSNGQVPPTAGGSVCDSLLSRPGSSPSPGFGLLRGAGGIGGGTNFSPAPYTSRVGGKKGDRGAGRAVSAGEGERMLSSSLVTAASIAALWNQVGCVGDRAAPNEETLLQIFAHTALVINVCGEIWLAALRRFCPHVCVEPHLTGSNARRVGEGEDEAQREAKRMKRGEDEDSEARGRDASLEGIWERMNVKKLSEAWWIQMCRSGKKIEDPCDLQWRYLSTRLDVLLLLVLLWKQFRRSSFSFAESPACAGGTTAHPTVHVVERHRMRWMSVNAANEALFAKANLGGRGEGLTPRQKEILDLCGAPPVEKERSPADSLASSASSQSQGPVENITEKVIQSSLLTFAAKHPSSVLQQPDNEEDVREARVTKGSIEDVQQLRNFILEVSTLLRFVFDPSKLPLVASPPFGLEDGEETPDGKAGENGIWNWALAASLNRCKSWVEAETFLWHLPLMRSKWLARLALWSVCLPEERGRAKREEAVGGCPQELVTPSGAVASFSPSDVAALARAVGLEAARAIELPRGEAGDQEKQHRREQDVRVCEATSSDSASLDGGRARGTTEDANTPFFSSALFSSALCDAVDALMISCIQAFGAEAMLDPAATEKGDEKKDNIQSKGNRPQERGQPQLCLNNTGKGAVCSGETAESDDASLLASPKGSSKKKEDDEGKQGEKEMGGCAASVASARVQDDVRFVSSRLSLSLFYACLGDMEELVEADGDVLPLAMPLYHLHSLRLKILMLSRGALWRLAALFPWRSASAGGSDKSQDKNGQKDSKVSVGLNVPDNGVEVEEETSNEEGSRPLSPCSIRQKRDDLLRRWLTGAMEDNVRWEYGRLRRQGASGLCCGVTISKERSDSMEKTRNEEREADEEELKVLGSFRCPADVVADCIEALQYLALKSRQAGLWTSIPRLLLVNASLTSGHPTLALRHLRQLFSRGATKLLPPDAWLSNHYQALKQRRPAYERSKFRLFHATVDTAVLLAQAVLQRTEKTKEEQLLAIRREDAGGTQDHEETKQNDPVIASPGGEDERDEKRQSIPKEVAGEGWIFGGLEKVEHLDDLVQGVKFLVEQLELQLKLLRRLQLNELGTYLQLAYFQDPSPQNTNPGTPFHTLQTQIAQLCQSPNAGGLVAEGRGEKGTGGSSSGASTSGDRASVQGAANFLLLMNSLLGSGGAGGQTGVQGTTTDEDGQQANKRMQREIVKVLLKGTIDVFEYLVTYCPDVLDMREMHRAITQLFPEVGVPAVEPQNTYVATTASLDGRLLRLLRDAVTCVRHASPGPASDLLRQLKQLIREKAAEDKKVEAGEEVDMGASLPSMEATLQNENAVETGVAHAPDDNEDDGVIEQFIEKLEDIFVSACRKLLYYNPPSPSSEDSAASLSSSEGAQTQVAPPAVAVMRLSLGLPVQCGMEVQEIEKVTEALLAYAKATRAGAPSIELFLKSGRVTAMPSGRGGKGHGSSAAHGAGGGETGRKERGRGGRGGGGGAAQARGAASGGNGNAEAAIKAEGSGSKAHAETLSPSPQGPNRAGSCGEGAGGKERGAGGEKKRRKNEETGEGGLHKTPRTESVNKPVGEAADVAVKSIPSSPVPYVDCAIDVEGKELHHTG